jgi:hypothetical protein
MPSPPRMQCLPTFARVYAFCVCAGLVVGCEAGREGRPHTTLVCGARGLGSVWPGMVRKRKATQALISTTLHIRKRRRSHFGASCRKTRQPWTKKVEIELTLACC